LVGLAVPVLGAVGRTVIVTASEPGALRAWIPLPVRVKVDNL
jgi:hypothetical protein